MWHFLNKKNECHERNFIGFEIISIPLHSTFERNQTSVCHNCEYAQYLPFSILTAISLLFGFKTPFRTIPKAPYDAAASSNNKTRRWKKCKEFFATIQATTLKKNILLCAFYLHQGARTVPRCLAQFPFRLFYASVSFCANSVHWKKSLLYASNDSDDFGLREKQVQRSIRWRMAKVNRLHGKIVCIALKINETKFSQFCRR